MGFDCPACGTPVRQLRSGNVEQHRASLAKAPAVPADHFGIFTPTSL